MTRPCALAGAVALAGFFTAQAHAAPLLGQTVASPWSGYPNLPVAVDDLDETAGDTFGEQVPAAAWSPTLDDGTSVQSEDATPTVAAINDLFNSPPIDSNSDLGSSVVIGDDAALPAGLAAIAASAAVEPAAGITASAGTGAAAIAAIDEPGTLVLLGVGLSMVVVAMKRQAAVRR